MTAIEKLEHLSRRFWVESFALRNTTTNEQDGFSIQLHITEEFYVWGEFPANTLEESIDRAYERGKDEPLLLSDEAKKRDAEWVRFLGLRTELDPLITIEEITEEPTRQERRDSRVFILVFSVIILGASLWLLLIYGQ